ncbi:hypothetical protein GQX74_014972 [Glossina fuscipes]|nr:hypothetical protein GQX74_014972 [Glossina fuscipes]
MHCPTENSILILVSFHCIYVHAYVKVVMITRPTIKLFFIVQNKPQNILVFIHPRKPHQYEAKVTVSHYTVRRANFASSGFRETGAQCSSQDHFIDLRTIERHEWRMDRLISLPKALICSSRRVSQKKLPRLLECSKLAEVLGKTNVQKLLPSCILCTEDSMGSYFKFCGQKFSI